MNHRLSNHSFPALALVAMLAVPLPAGPAAKGPEEQGNCGKCCQKRSEKEDRATARQLVESRTGGLCVSLRRASINGSTRPGFEALVHMPGKQKGWRCLVDLDMPAKVYRTEEIPNPPAPRPGAKVE
jgi:hypothetical protein